MDEFGPLNLQPHPGRQWAPVAVGTGTRLRPGAASARDLQASPRRAAPAGRLRPVHATGSTGTSSRTQGPHRVPGLLPLPALATSRPRCASRSCSTTSPRTCPPRPTHGSATGPRRNNVELAYVPFYGSWLNRIEAQFTALRYFALDGTDHPSHAEQARMIRRYIAWRNRHVTDPRLRKVIKRAAIIKKAKVA